MTEYQKAVAYHMKDAPQELREYVCERLRESDEWEDGGNPIGFCSFLWRESKEDYLFWDYVSYKNWQEAMNTDFWKEHTAQEERPEGVIGHWYTLTSDFWGAGGTKDREAGYTWECETLDFEKEPTINGVGIAFSESYRKATPEEIRRAMAERIKTYRQNKKRPSEQDKSYSELIKEEYDRLAEKQIAKNKDYGDSAFEDIFLMGENISAKQACLARMSDKIKRLQSKELKVDESHSDTLNDLVGYIVVWNILNK